MDNVSIFLRYIYVLYDKGKLISTDICHGSPSTKRPDVDRAQMKSGWLLQPSPVE